MQVTVAFLYIEDFVQIPYYDTRGRRSDLRRRLACRSIFEPGSRPPNMGKKLFLKILRVIDNSVENT